MVSMMPLPELLQDKTFRKFFTTTPAMYEHQAKRPDGWRIWVKPTAVTPWRRKNVAQYQSGVRFILGGIDEGSVHDAVLQCRGVSYGPPVKRFLIKDPKTGQPVLQVDSKGRVSKKIKEVVWAPSPDLTQEYGRHDWCFYCRRPTVFAYFAKHQAFIGTPLEHYYDGAVRRCAVCGISHDLGRRY